MSTSDTYCHTLPDGSCDSTDPRCMHQPRYSLAEIFGDEVEPVTELVRLARDCDVAASSALEEGAKLRHQVSEGETPNAEVDATLAAAREWDGTYHDMRKIALVLRRVAQSEP